MKSLEGKRFVVTGAASGVGAALAAVLQDGGASVIGLDIRHDQARCDESIHCDLADPASIDAVVAGLKGPLDGLINVAGVPGSMPMALVAKVNFLGLRHLTAQLLPRIGDGGVVINVASTAGAGWRDRKDRALPLLLATTWEQGLAVFDGLDLDPVAAYDFTKEAVILYSMLISSQERHRGVRVNSISPGAVQTPILKDFYATMGSDLLGKLRTQAGGRDAQPLEVARAIALLLDDGFFWMNGVDLILDGGAEVVLTLGSLATPATTVPGGGAAARGA